MITDRPRRFIPASPNTGVGQALLIFLGGPILWGLALWFFIVETLPDLLQKLVPISVLRNYYYKKDDFLASEILKRETEITHKKTQLAELKTQLARINGEYLDLLAEKISSACKPNHHITEESHYDRFKKTKK